MYAISPILVVFNSEILLGTVRGNITVMIMILPNLV